MSVLTIVLLIMFGSFLLIAQVIVAMVVGGWLVFKGRSTVEGESFLRRDTSPGVYSINTDGQDFPGQKPGQKPDKNEEHILKKTESFLRSLGGGNVKS